MTYDLLIIGAGPMGIAVGIEARKRNLEILILEQGALVNSLFHFPKNMQFFSTSQKLEIGNVPFISHHEKPLRDEALEYYRRVVQQWDLPIKYYEKVLHVQKNEVYHVQSEKSEYRAKNVVVATGFYSQPNLMNVPGEDLPKVSHYYDEPHPYIQQKVAVIGAANSATQVALELYHKGADVTMIIREERIPDNVKYWIKPNIENRIEEGAIQAYFSSKVVEIKEESIIISQNGQLIELENDFVFAMTGYLPDFDFLRKIGVQCQADEFETPYYDESTHQTNIPGLYVAGVICGGKNTSKYFIENSREHAERILQSIVQTSI
ncbi:MAG: YpdA family putative bacillithiol disulfide reductase [Weeksellaceae bacterium]|nr:YpdA family putative bacillithiol disulfide reductase [Weeksellaceae bacterium]